MKRFIAYFVSGVRTDRSSILPSFTRSIISPRLSIQKLVWKYFSPLYDEWLNGDALVDFGRP